MRVMMGVILTAVLQSGCALYFGGEGDTEGVALAPDAGPGIVVYPCSVQHEACAAAKAAAEIMCDWALTCDPLAFSDRHTCIANRMYTICGGGQACNVSPYDSSELDACVAEYDPTTCASPSVACTL